MRCRLDLHIHSALSPCGDMDMTPNNIVNMAVLNGLDIIAITDHNSIGNAEAMMACATDKPLVVVPGMELETAEEAHFVCLFPDMRRAQDFNDFITAYRLPIENRPEIFGEQAYMNAQDEITGYEGKLLTAALTLSVYEAAPMVADLGGVIYPAHVNKEAYSIISNLGTMPEDLGFHAAEISRHMSFAEAMLHWPYLENYQLITSSDAHYLWDIYEGESVLELEEKTATCLIDTLRKGK